MLLVGAVCDWDQKESSDQCPFQSRSSDQGDLLTAKINGSTKKTWLPFFILNQCK